MKYTLLFSFLFATAIGSAQVTTTVIQSEPSSISDGPTSEVHWNIANTIALGSVEVGYEYFLDGHQSIGADVLINDVYNYSIGRQAKDFDTNSFQLSYNYYTSPDNNNSEWMITPFLKFRTGEYQKTASDPIIDMSAFILGIGGGYKWNLNDKFVFGPQISVARNFSQEVLDEFNVAVEFNAAFVVGYRF
ncbi:MAG TPA: DUF3575 domain-containing protein [Flavobacterium sp.]|jgi:hypothetical protein